MKLSQALSVIVVAAIVGALAVPTAALDPAAVSRLKKAGAGDAVLAALVREKSIETAAFTVDDIVRLKNAGVGDETLIKMIEDKSFVRGKTEVVYGEDVRPATRATVSDLLKLKEAGISEDVINTIVKNQAVDPNVAEQRRAMEILKDMNLLIDVR